MKKIIIFLFALCVLVFGCKVYKDNTYELSYESVQAQVFMKQHHSFTPSYKMVTFAGNQLINIYGKKAYMGTNKEELIELNYSIKKHKKSNRIVSKKIESITTANGVKIDIFTADNY